MRNRTVACVVATLLLGLAAPGVANAVQPVEVKVEGAAVAPRPELCTLSTETSITFDGDPTEYSLNSAGEIQEGSAESRDSCAQRPTGITILANPVALGTKTFTNTNRTYSASDSNGRFNGQYTPGNRHVVAFNYEVATALKSIATGNAKASVSRTPEKMNCAYNKTQGVSYGFHWSCGTPFAAAQTLNGKWTFPIRLNSQNGTAEIKWVFNYSVRNQACAPGVPC